MVTARRPFAGDNNISILAAIMEKEPQPASQVVTAIPPELDRIIARCLRKDRERRFQHMGDVRVALDELREEFASAVQGATPQPRVQRWGLPFAVAIGAAAIATAATSWLARPETVPALGTMQRITNDTGLTFEPALSPDGKLVAYASDRAGEGKLDIWVQQVAGGEPIRLTHDPADDRNPAFSADGSRIAYRSDREGGGIYTMPALGGEARLLVKDGQNPVFSPDDKWIAYWIGRAGGSRIMTQAFVVPSEGGQPRRLQQEFEAASMPVWSPDGKHLLLWGSRNETAATEAADDWWVTPLEDGAAVKTGAVLLGLRNLNPSVYQWWLPAGVWLPDGHVLYSACVGDTCDLWEMAITPRTWKAFGSPRRLTGGPVLSGQPAVASHREGNGPSSSRLAFASFVHNVQIWNLALDANTGKVRGEPQRLTAGPAWTTFASLSQNGERLVFERQRAGSRDIWLKDLRSGRETNLMPVTGNRYHPVITADGSKVSYSENKGGKDFTHILPLSLAADGALQTGTPETVCEECLWAWSWSNDGKRVLMTMSLPGRPIAEINVASGERTTILSHPKYNVYQAKYSPDGGWVAFTALVRPQLTQLFIAPLRPAPATAAEGIPSDWIPVTSGDSLDDKPRWSPDGNLLYFVSKRDGFLCLWAQRLEAVSKRPAGPPFAVYHFHSATHSMLGVGMPALEPAVARDRIIFNLAETTANIWMTELGVAH
jgi:Tol biopolymer transport system component